jgi:signal transduction histidine kinase
VIVLAVAREDWCLADASAQRPRDTGGMPDAGTDDAVRTARIVAEQGALRRVATLVARRVSQDDLFAAVNEEIARLVGADATALMRFEPDDAVTLVAAWSAAGASFPLSERGPVHAVLGAVRESGRAARLGPAELPASGPFVEEARRPGIRTSVGVPIEVDGRAWGVSFAASSRPCPFPDDTEARIGQFIELVATAIANIEVRSELATSRAQIVTAADAERRRVLRDLHDGAQQRLTYTIITLKLACQALESNAGDGPALVAEALDHAQQATAELRELVHGSLPSVLTHGGLRAGVRALAARMPIRVENQVPTGRLPAAVEATAYFVVAEALTNVAKHSGAGRASVTACIHNGMFRLNVRDDGVGGAQPDGSGLLGLADRVAGLAGRLNVRSTADSGTVVTADIPLRAHRSPLRMP